MVKSFYSKISSEIKTRVSVQIRLARSLYRWCSYTRKIGIERLLWTIDSFEFAHGHFRSFQEQLPVDMMGQPIPWYTYPAIEYLQQLDFSGFDAFEYGSGNSSLFWSKRCGTVTSVESDRNWYLKIKEKQYKNQQILFAQDKEDYVSQIFDGRKYPLIIIDGIHRLFCSKAAVQCLAPGGLIILDNSDWHPLTAEFLRNSGLIQIDFTGFGPINYYAWTTSIFLHRDFNLKAASGHQPQPGIASLIQVAQPE